MVCCTAQDEAQASEHIRAIRREHEERNLVYPFSLPSSECRKIIANCTGNHAGQIVSELLRNGDQNSYTKAKASGFPPSMHFTLRAQQVIIDCNDDGLTKEAVDVLCAVSRSPKPVEDSRTGITGIGFKSLFSVASDVRIQSGPYSLAFSYVHPSAASYMAYPIQDNKPPLNTHGTRITLNLPHKFWSSEAEDFRSLLGREVNRIGSAHLPFLNNIAYVTVKAYNSGGILKRHHEFRRLIDANPANPAKPFIHTVSQPDHPTKRTEDTVTYYVFRHVERNVPHGENRVGAIPGREDDDASTTSEICLAFPATIDNTLDETPNNPKPYRLPAAHEWGYKFSIQADLDTSLYNPHEYSYSSERNRHLVDAIANSIVKAILHLCQHTSLCYSWPLYLEKPSPASRLWCNLHERVHQVLNNTGFQSARACACLATAQRVLVPHFNIMDPDLDLLVDNPVDHVTPGPPFLLGHVAEQHGISHAKHGMFLDLLWKDLLSPTSKCRNPRTSDDWHVRVADRLQSCYHNADEITNILLWYHLPFIPLYDGRWVPLSVQNIFLTAADNPPPPPTCMALNIVDPNTMKNPKRLDLLRRLGITDMDPRTIQEVILAHWESYGSSVENCIELLKYLYVTQLSKQQRSSYITLFDHKGRRVDPEEVVLYIQNDNRLGPHAVLGSEKAEINTSLNFTYLSPRFSENPPPKPTEHSLSWEDWLRDTFGVRSRFQLVNAAGDNLDPAMLHILRYQPAVFLEVLADCWAREHIVVLGSTILMEKIKNLDASGLCNDQPVGGSFLLRDTWLPEASDGHRYRGVPDRPGPVLSLENDPANYDSKYDFLKEHFCNPVHRELLNLLHSINKCVRSDGLEVSANLLSSVCLTYLAIGTQIKISGKQEEEAKALCQRLKETPFILLPGPPGTAANWARISDCLWRGPQEILRSHILHDYYDNCVKSGQIAQAQVDKLSEFFQVILGINSINDEVIIKELSFLRDDQILDHDRICSLYASMTGGSRKVRDQFANDCLIYAVKYERPGWYTSRECLWSSSTDIQGKAILEPQYPDMEKLFVENLGIPSLTINVVYAELCTTTIRTDPKKLKSRIFALNELLVSAESPPDPEKMLLFPVFPVCRLGHPSRATHIGEGFIVGDRLPLLTHFENRTDFLDYTPEEVWTMRPFLKWAGLEDRFISTRVTKITSVPDYAGCIPLTAAKFQLGPKTEAILRIACHFQSPRYPKELDLLYQLLQSAKMVETDTILTTLTLDYPRRVTADAGEMEREHIQEDDKELTIFISAKQKDRELSLCSSLPKKLAEWLQLDRQKDTFDRAVHLLALILSTPRSVIPDFLDEKGVSRVHMPNEGSPDSSQLMDWESVSDTEMTPAISWDSEAHHDNQPSPQGHGDILKEESQDISEVLHDTQASLQAPEDVMEEEHQKVPQDANVAERTPVEPVWVSRASTIDAIPSWDNEYLQFCKEAKRMGKRSVFPTFGVKYPDQSKPTRHLDWQASYDGAAITSGSKSTQMLEHHQKLGAGGQLFVYEMLSKLGLPNWSRDNWTCKIRHHVSILPDFANIGHCQDGPADFVYHDYTGALTDNMIQYGYLKKDVWGECKPKYFFLVKSTTGPCAVPFHIGRSEFELMNNIHHSGERDVLMVIMRVYSLGNGTALKVYADPEDLRQEGALKFNSELWTITPGGEDQ